MAFEDNLPVGSTPFSNTLYKDPSDRIWTGNPFQSEFYRFLDRSEVEFIYVNIKDFGAVGDGVTDDTEAFENALDEAKSSGNYLYFPDGVYPITVSDDSVNMNGCLGLLGKGEMLVSSGSSNVDSPIFLWEGEKERIASAVPVSLLQNTFTVDTGKDISQGDTVFLVSDELITPDINVRYVKGGRFTVNDYNPSTGEINFFEGAYFDIEEGYFYHNTVRPRVQIQDVKITHVDNRDKKGIEVICAEVFVGNCVINGFGRFALNVASSLGRVINSSMSSRSITGTPSGYALQVSDASEVFATGGNFNAYRHGVATGGTAYWQASDVDGEPTTSSWIRPPCIARLSGCRVAGDDYAVDSHPGTVLLDVYNCDIYGGVQLGGIETYINLSRIDQGAAPAAIRFGRDRTFNSGVYYGKYAIRSCDVRVRSKLFWVYADLNYLGLKDVNVYTYGNPDTLFTAFSSNSSVLNWDISGLNHFGQPTDTDVEYEFDIISPIQARDLNLKYASALFRVRSTGVRNIFVSNSYATLGRRGIAISASGTTFQNTYDVSFIGCVFNDIPGNGTNLLRCKNITINSCVFNNCETSVNILQQTGGAMNLNVNATTIRQSSGNVINVGGSQVVNTVLVGNIIDGSTDMNVNLVGKHGNIGLDDKLKTSLTSASTDKYGADGTTGDLTLS